MTRGSVLPKSAPSLVTIHLHAFSLKIRILFIVLVSALIIGELTPVPMWSPVPFYSYCAIKLLTFVVIGILAPIAFWRFNALNRGLLYAALSAAFVETMQSLTFRGYSGHAFHWYELVVKLMLILLGFAVGLDIRYERELKIGPVQIILYGRR